MSKRPKREYSRAFTPKGAGRAFTIGRIPEKLLKAAQAKAKREGKSLRAMFLRQLSEYVSLTKGDWIAAGMEETPKPEATSE